MSWVTIAFLLASSSLMIPIGKLADIYGRKKVFKIGMTIFAVGSILAVFAQSGTILLVSRGIQGIGSAAIFSTSVALLTSEFPMSERGKILGFNIAVVYFGLSLGPFLGGMLTRYFGWQSIFIITSVLNALVIIVAFWKLKREDLPLTKDKYDLLGSLLYTVALVLIMYGVTVLPKLNGVWIIIAGSVVGAVFIWWESRAEKPLVNLELFSKNRAFAFSNLAALINYAGTYVVAFLLSLLLQYTRGFNAGTAGLIMVTSPGVQAIFSPFTGRLSDRIEPRILASTGMAISAAGIGFLAFIGPDTHIGLIIGCLAFLGFGFALFSSPNTNSVMSSVEQKYYGVASATVSTMRQIGMMVSMGITTIVFNLLIGQVKIAPEHYQALTTSSHIIFGICAVLCFLGIFASLARGNIHKDNVVEVRNKPQL